MATTARNNEFAVIGAGFGRTGTSSLQRALNILGFNCYHTNQTFGKSEHELKITEISKKKCALKQKFGINEDYNQFHKIMVSEQDADDLFNALLYDKHDKNRLIYRATMDWPLCSYYQELMRKYPNAKIILTVRDSGMKWYGSLIATIYPMSVIVMNRWLWRMTPFHRHHNMAIHSIWSLIFDYNKENRFANDEKYGVRKYNEWIDSVKRYAKQQKRELLVFNVKQGWKPLCKFLEIKDIPQEPFPYVNERKNITRAIRIMNRISNVVDLTLITMAVSGVGYFAYKYAQKS